MRWLVERQLRTTSARLRKAREEVESLDYEVNAFSDDADDLHTLAITSEQVDARLDYQEAQHQTDVLMKARTDLRHRIEVLTAKQDSLLDKLGTKLDSSK